MKAYFGISAAVFALALASAGSEARAAIVDVNFDNLGSSQVVADGYGGINWHGEWSTLVQSGYPPQSPPNAIYNLAHNLRTDFSFVTPEVFIGAYFSGFSESNVSFQLYLNNALVATSASLSPTQTPTFLNSGYSGLVDQVVVVDSGDGAHYVVDDVTYQTTATSVPEPSSLMMSGLAVVAGIGSRLRRSRRKLTA